LAIELLTAAQAFEFRKPLKSGVLLDEVHKYIRKKVSFAEKDRVFSEDIEVAIEIIKSGSIINVIQQVMNKKNITWEAPFRKEFETL
jgi:histidine ammonia-lyase